jgi:hypothetical protein
MDITSWLEEFRKSWTSHDVEKVLSLFTEGVEYWENPYRLLQTRAELQAEWQGIQRQNSIELKTEVLFSEDKQYAVIWHLQYENQIGATQIWAGTYLIKLNEQGLCYYFHHTGEKKI